MIRRQIRRFVFQTLNKEYEIYRNGSVEKLQNISPDFISQYQEQEPLLTELLAQSRYWHGTGRFQYVKKGESKYEGVSHHETFDVLKVILQDQGLKPHYDPWVGKFTTTSYSLSVANQWGYGKMYAHYHQDEETSLLFEIAPIDFWFKAMLRIQLTENYFKFIFVFFIVYIFSNALQKQGKVWLSTFRSDTNKKWPYWKIMTTKSDIKGNYGILFAIRDGIETIKLPKLLQFFETRTAELVGLDKINFVAVPYENVTETKEIVRSVAPQIPVIPLEFLELYMRRFTLEEIMTPASFKI